MRIRTFLAAGLTVASLIAQDSTLKPGDPAPAFKVGRWIKGAPIPALEKGRVYVVEFWATWCGPCKASIPHLTELAKNYKDKATIIGVDCFERGNDATVDAAVDAFVAKMGSQMEYLVCRDSKDLHMQKAWMEAAKKNSIPTAFIVDASGRIAWIGSPMLLETHLPEVIAGKHDLQANAQKVRLEAEEAGKAAKRTMEVNNAYRALAKDLQAARSARNWQELLNLVEKGATATPELRPRLQNFQFLATSQLDRGKADGMIAEAIKGTDPLPCLTTAQEILAEPTLQDWTPKALALLERAATLKPSAMPEFCGPMLVALLRLDMAKARAFYQAQLKQEWAVSNPVPLMSVVVRTTKDIDPAWRRSALEALIALNGKDSLNQYGHFIAAGHARLGEFQRAAEVLAAGLEVWRKDLAPETLKRFEADLAGYREQAAQAAKAAK
jgi:thiol-disulfide isomerase/thioredoxin